LSSGLRRGGGPSRRSCRLRSGRLGTALCHAWGPQLTSATAHLALKRSTHSQSWVPHVCLLLANVGSRPKPQQHRRTTNDERRYQTANTPLTDSFRPIADGGSINSRVIIPTATPLTTKPLDNACFRCFHRITHCKSVI
jgi:hypothetical protein